MDASPAAVATAHSLRWVLSNLQRKPSRILEVGCGSGHLARALDDSGHHVVAVDSSEEAIAAALAKGLDAQVARFEEYIDEPFDCVLFSRSLHHILPVSQAVNTAAELLKPTGMLLVDDFAFESASLASALWFRRLLALLNDAGFVEPANEGFARQVLESRPGDMSPWKHEAHDAAPWDLVVAQVTNRFEARTESAPYLYRYVIEVVRADSRAKSIVERCLELEEASATLDPAFLIGRRLVGHHRA